MANERTGEGQSPETGEARAASKPLNPLSALTLVLVFPARTFERLRERPHWVVPLLFVVGASMLTAIYAAQGGYMDEYLNSMAFRSGTDPETLRAGFLAAGALMAAVGVPLVTLLEALFFALAGTLAGGRASFKAVFSAVAYASVPVGIGSIVFAILMPLTGSAEVGANLAASSVMPPHSPPP